MAVIPESADGGKGTSRSTSSPSWRRTGLRKRAARPSAPAPKRSFPTKGAYQATYRGGGGELVFPRYGVVPYDAGDIFVAKFSAANQQLVFSTYIGGARSAPA